LASFIVALTGASGAIYGIRLVEELLKKGDDVDLIVSPTGFLILREELSFEADVTGGKDAGAELTAFFERRNKKEPVVKGRLTYHPSDDLTSGVASGSSMKKTMVVCPCSMGTLGRIASGASTGLIERAADCVLKERGLLVLVPRETPLNAIHLENMLKLSRAGAVILPAMPAFYTKPSSVDEMVDFVVGRILDMVGVENTLYKRWKRP